MCLSRFAVPTFILVLSIMFADAEPPQAPEIPHEIAEAGHTRNDPFFWLREKANPDVLKYLQAENRYTETALKPTEKLRDTIYHEMRRRIRKMMSRFPKRSATITTIPGQRRGNSMRSTAGRKGALKRGKR